MESSLVTYSREMTEAYQKCLLTYLQTSQIYFKDTRKGGSKEDKSRLIPRVDDFVLWMISEKPPSKKFAVITAVNVKEDMNLVQVRRMKRGRLAFDVVHIRVLRLIYRKNDENNPVNF